MPEMFLALGLAATLLQQDAAPAILLEESHPALGAPSLPSVTPNAAMPTIRYVLAEPTEPRFWLGAEYLGWRTNTSALPALLVRNPLGTPQATVGLPGPGGEAVFGGKLLGELRSGVRFGGGWWLGEHALLAAEAEAWFLAGATAKSTTDQAAVYSRPFENVLTGRPDAQLVHFPGVVTGTATAELANRAHGFSAGLRRRLGECSPFALVGGYSNLRYSERLTIGETLRTAAGSPFLAEGDVQLRDEIRTSNQFHGAHLGLAGFGQRGAWSWSGLVRIAAGLNNQTAGLSGQTSATVGGMTNAAPAGLLVLPSNAGTHRRAAGAWLPEARLALGWHPTDALRVFAGCDFLRLNQVQRPGDVLDPALNPAQLPPAQGGGPSRPGLRDGHSSLRLQGFHAGLELHY